MIENVLMLHYCTQVGARESERELGRLQTHRVSNSFLEKKEDNLIDC